MKISHRAATSVLEVCSAGAITAGAFVFHVAAGLVVAGGFGMLFAKAVAR